MWKYINWSGTLNTLWGIRQGWKDEEESGEESGNEFENEEKRLKHEDQKNENPIIIVERYHLVTLSLMSEELVVMIQYGRRWEASKIITLHYQSAG